MQVFYLNMKIKLAIIFSLLGSVSAFSQPNPESQNNPAKNNDFKDKQFEGSIRFIQENLDDTLYYTYYIKDYMVRLDVQENCKDYEKTDNYLLFDLNNGTITAIKPSQKMFINVPPKPYIDSKDQNYQIIKTNNNKKIQGYKCYQWRVKNKYQNTEISYWVAQDNFNFFEDFLRLWNRSEKHALYFLQIPDATGFFPMLSEERTILREQKMTLRVTEVVKKDLNQTIFVIPKEYKSYEH
ncbi:MAG: hypothetical protein COX07_08380 [Bacteroidetes bacterium CG23_combo_of_CG06-09_8_20_14_all_32_9]|nr:MAG: hypothetical protein COX07_08380 [Bacteroidetes bacterium CG23_combo_of_CG06-09_8_20_14_all_32_9]